MFSAVIPQEISLHILSYLNFDELLALSFVNKQFYSLANHHSLILFQGKNQFKEICQKIESNPNFKPNISDEELLDLVRDENGNARYSIAKTSLAFVPFSSELVSGKMYEIKIAMEQLITVKRKKDSWGVLSLFLLIKRDGTTLFYADMPKTKDDLANPIKHNLEAYLERPSLHHLIKPDSSLKKYIKL